MKVWIVLLLASLGTLLLSIDAILTGGAISGSAPAGLLPGGLAFLGASWVVANIPAP